MRSLIPIPSWLLAWSFALLLLPFGAARTSGAVRVCPIDIPASAIDVDPSQPRFDPAQLGDGTLVAFAEIEARPEQVWSVLTDFEAWPRVFEEIQRVEVRRRPGAVISVRQTNLRFGWAVAYTSIPTLRPEQGRVEMQLDPRDPHDIEWVHAVWEIRSAPDSANTQVALYLHVETGLPIPRFVERRWLEDSARQTVRAVAVESKSRCARPRETAPG